MHGQNVRILTRLFAELGIEHDPQDRRRINTLADLDPQTMQMVAELMRKAYSAGQASGSVGGSS
ncbi:hypothetical protein [Nonomuraea sp. NPDC050786]|uniref:hypothetical protein n=1 Tax=Nonomuraea sp. NPDC050786 TaxID=3154840 RepID=UPI0033DF4DFE